MDVLTLAFVGLLLIAALFLTLNVRRQILRAAEARRLRDQQLGAEMRRQNAMQGNPRSATRR
jgi:heme exporter protein D